MGIADPAFIAAQPMMFAGQDATAAAMRAAKTEADSLATSWANQDRS
jgi:FMN-dependent NADH-azoreductase